MTPEPVEQCTATTAAGTRCTHTHDVVDGRCLWHDPGRSELLREYRQRGAATARGKAKEKRKLVAAAMATTAGPRPPVGDTLSEVCVWLRYCLTAASLGEITAPQLSAFTQGARVLQGAIEKRDLERALKETRKELDRLKRRMAA